MSFLNPWLLLGVAGIASPIIIHLLAKKQTKRVVWAAMRFLTATVERNRRRMNLEDILLLVLRCLVIALLALALARPALRSTGPGILGTGEVAIVLLDNSGSMSTTDGVASRFEKGQKAAEQVIDALPSGSAVAVWLVSDVVKDVIPEPTRDLALARKVIREAKRTDQATEWQPALRKAVEVAGRQAGASKQIYAITDAQSSGWGSVAEARNLLEAAKEDVQSRLVVVNDGEQANLGVTDVRLASAMVTVNQPIRFEVSVANFGSEEQRDVSVSLAIDDEPPSEEQVITSLPPTGEAKAISLFANFPTAGVHTVTARVRSDRCPFDDHRTLALKIPGEVDVLLVDGDPGLEPRDSEVFYLRNALTPVPLEMRDRYFIKTKTVAAAELERLVLGEYEAIILANVVDLSAVAITALESYVRAGGGLMVFPGSRISVPFYNDRLHTLSRLLPAAFGTPRGETVDESKAERPQTFFTLEAKGYEHRIVAPWKDPNNGNLATAQFYRAFPLIPAPASSIKDDVGPAGVVLAFADDVPAMVERSFGSGRVLQFASSADAGWNDLPVRPVFLPLMHRALGYLLAGEEDRLNIRAGTPFRYPMALELMGKEVFVVEPGGKKETTRPRRLELLDQTPVVRQEETSLAGAYQVLVPDAPEAELRFAAYFDPAESNLRQIPAADLKTLGQVMPVVDWGPGSDLRVAIRKQRTGTELWIALLIAVVVLAVAETVLGNRWSRSR
jgi:hypothetical protein